MKNWTLHTKALVIFSLFSLFMLQKSAEGAAYILESSGNIVAVHKGVELSTLARTPDGKQTGDGREEQEKTELPPGTVVTTGEDGKATIEVAPGIYVELQPNTQIVIGDIIPKGAQDAFGNSIDLATITVNWGTVATMFTDMGLATTGFSVITPRGSTSPIIAGASVIIVEGRNPEQAVVTVASIKGAEMVTTEAGEQIPVGEGLAVILRPGNEHSVELIERLPNSSQILAIAQGAFSNLQALNPTPVTPPFIPPQFPPNNNIPPNQPSEVPTPTPAPTPIPSPSPQPISP